MRRNRSGSSKEDAINEKVLGKLDQLLELLQMKLTDENRNIKSENNLESQVQKTQPPGPGSLSEHPSASGSAPNNIARTKIDNESVEPEHKPVDINAECPKPPCPLARFLGTLPEQKQRLAALYPKRENECSGENVETVKMQLQANDKRSKFFIQMPQPSRVVCNFSSYRLVTGHWGANEYPGQFKYY